MKLNSITTLLLAAGVTVVAGERGPGCPSGDQTPKPMTPTPTTPTTPTPTPPTPPIGYTLRFAESSTDKFIDVKPALFVCYTIGSCFTAGAWGDEGSLSLDARNTSTTGQYMATFEGPDCTYDTYLVAVRPRPGSFRSFHVRSFAMIPIEWTSVENLTTTHRVGLCE